MKQLNLIPQRLKDKQRERGQNFAAVFAFVVAAAALGGGYVYVGQLKSQAAASFSAAQDRLDVVRRQAGQEVAKDPAVADASARITQLNKLTAQDIDWNATLGSAAVLLDPGLRLTTLSVGAAGSAVTVTENGTAPSNAAFAAFVDTMDKRTDISAFKVLSYAYVPDGGSVSFSVSYAFPASSLRFKKQL